MVGREATGLADKPPEVAVQELGHSLELVAT